VPGLHGRRALVTGGGRGIGRATALDLARAGAAVALVSRTAGDVLAVAGEVERLGGRAVPVPADVSRVEEVRRAFAEARASIARLAEKTGRPAEDLRRRMAEASPQKRICSAEEVSALILFLCGEAASGINGQALSVDGGTVV
jgi:NAD(P)-dependent dehydrogenase (short-subunit alcohol dehydrogenase family)